MQAGDLNRRITVQKYTYEVDDYGTPIETWVDVGTVWAAREDVSDSEKLAGYGPVSTLISRFTVLKSSLSETFSVDDRFTHDGLAWEITGIKEAKENPRQFLEITSKVRLS